MSYAVKLSVVMLLVTITVLVLWFSWSFKQLSVTPEPFVSGRWKVLAFFAQGSNDPGCYRGAMALDAVEKKMFIGKKSHDLSTLLGVPEKQMREQWSYSVGQCSGDWGQ